MKPEMRFSQIEYREAEGAPVLVGHASVFSTRTSIGGWYDEMVMPGAFKDAIGISDVRALFNHDPNFVLGRNTSGTLRLSEDSVGLVSEIMPPDTQMARDLLTQMKRGDITQMSFAFTVDRDGQRWERDGNTDVRVITRVNQLYDVSVVTYPAYPDATVGVRSKEIYDSFKAQQAERLVVPVSVLRRRLDLATRS